MRIRAHASSSLRAARRILIVEDDVDLRETLVEALASLGFVAVGFASVEAARHGIERGQYDAILSDLEIPGESGFHFARWLRSHPDPCVRDTPAVAVSAHRSREDRCEALAAGFAGFLAKPYDMDDVRRALAAVLQRLD